MAGALQQAARDHAAVTALAMDSYGSRSAEVRQFLRESIERVPVGFGDVARLPLAFAAHVEDGEIAAGLLALLIISILI